MASQAAAQPFDYWTVLSEGMTDPHVRVGGAVYCRAESPNRKYVCTRIPHHPGLHVASYIDGRVCCTAWGPAVPRELQLPEGF